MTPARLNQTHFSYMLLVALGLHAAAAIGWMLSPDFQVHEIPVHVLNIKLGTADLNAQGDEKAGTHNVAMVKPGEMERAASKPAKPPYVEKRAASPLSKPALPKSPQTPVVVPGFAATTQTLSPFAARQYIRNISSSAGSEMGVANGTEEIVRRYEQTLSLWVQQHRGALDAALQPGVQGKVIIRLRIDRSGKILFFALEHSTGLAALDDAVANMVRSTNPVPAVPANYPAGNLFEFLIPISYKAL